MYEQGSKNIKMLKDVGMTVLKGRETSAVYVQQDRGWGQSVRQGMRACNNNNMDNLSLHLFL